MRMINLGKPLVLTTILLIFCLNNSWLCAAEEEEEELFYNQLTRAVVRLEERQSICVPGRKWSVEKDVSIGSAFFVKDRLPGKNDKPEIKLFIVTARHIVDRHHDLFARVQKSPGSSEYFVLLLPRKLWVFHPESTPKK